MAKSINVFLVFSCVRTITAGLATGVGRRGYTKSSIISWLWYGAEARDSPRDELAIHPRGLVLVFRLTLADSNLADPIYLYGTLCGRRSRLGPPTAARSASAEAVVTQ